MSERRTRNWVRKLLLPLFMLLIVSQWRCTLGEGHEKLLSIGQEQGIDSTSVISGETLRKILEGVEKGNKDNIYFYGLLKLYGLAVSKDVPGAGAQFKRAASLGHKEATTAFGVMQMTGAEGLVNDIEAIRYFREGVSKGDANAHWLLGTMLAEGRGVPQPSFLEAAVHFQFAASHGIAQAQHSLALMYEYGQGIQQSFAKAAELYEKAAGQNYVESMYNLALLYAYGRGFPQDLQRARSLFDAAARFDHAPSLYYIGIYKTYGYGCEINYDQAINWFERAASLDDYRVSAKAASAARELQGFMADAHRKNELLMDELQRRSDQRD